MKILTIREQSSVIAQCPRRVRVFRYFYFDLLTTNFCKQPPDLLVWQPAVKPAKMFPNSSADKPSGLVPGTKYFNDPSVALPMRIPFFQPGFRMALPPPSGASGGPAIFWLDSESATISVSSFKIAM